ncbi:MAG: LysM peptidoglycan-binding domain-containing protein, partial [Rhodobacteraceae bacterium]|nr:LysM peptidoglycan-binding domain-containing protein [Paracoccaceae bacterium]
MRNYIAVILLLSAASLPASAADLIRCPDAASLIAAAQASASAPKADFATLTAPRAGQAPQSRAAGVGAVSTAPLDPMGILAAGSNTANAPTARAAAPTLPVIPSSCVYTIKPGDTLGGIAARELGAQSAWTRVQAANPGLKPNALVPGQTITLPCAAPTTPTTTTVAAPGLRTLVAPDPASGSAKPTDKQPAAQAAPAAVVPPPPPLPIWTARSGEYFSDVVKRWAKDEGYS